MRKGFRTVLFAGCLSTLLSGCSGVRVGKYVLYSEDAVGRTKFVCGASDDILDNDDVISLSDEILEPYSKEKLVDVIDFGMMDGLLVQKRENSLIVRGNNGESYVKEGNVLLAGCSEIYPDVKPVYGEPIFIFSKNGGLCGVSGYDTSDVYFTDMREVTFDSGIVTFVTNNDFNYSVPYRDFVARKYTSDIATSVEYYDEDNNNVYTVDITEFIGNNSFKEDLDNTGIERELRSHSARVR